MRILVFHGYLLRGTGSNVYNAELAAAFVGLGHEVHLLSQDRAPEELPFVDAVGDWDAGELTVRPVREPVRCTVYRPAIGGLLPAYVADRYDGVEARPFPDCTPKEIDAYLSANVRAVEDVVARVAPDVALANHLVMGPAILARGLSRSATPYAVKIHGSALEYTVKPHPERFLPPAREGVGGARGVLVGSRHVAQSLWEALDDPRLAARTRLGPPGVDVSAFRPLRVEQARESLEALAEQLRGLAEAGSGATGDSVFARDEAAAAAAVEQLAGAPGGDRLVAYVGKFLAAKGVDLLLAAWPLVLSRVPSARLVLVGFGGFEKPLRSLAELLGRGDIDGARDLARPDLGYLDAFLTSLEGECLASYRAAARRLPDRVTWVGRLEHSELAGLLPACEAQVVPSTFPEAFGMVAAEAAACGVLPISAAHSGLAEVTEELASAVPVEARDMLSFSLGPGAVAEIAVRLVDWLDAPEEVRSATRDGLVATARERYSWEGVAGGVIAAAQGRLGELPSAS
ncbi:MAG: glycosyltransferase family 4 protein [Solirubrobacteraceae bacterium]